MLLTPGNTNSLPPPIVLWALLEKNHSQVDGSYYSFMVINLKWPLSTEKKLQNYVSLVVLLFYSPYLCNIDKNLLYSSQTSEFCHTHTPLPTQPCRITQQAIWGNQTSVFIEKQKPSKGPPQIPATRTITQISLCLNLFFPPVSEEEVPYLLQLLKCLTLSCIFKLSHSTGSFPSVSQHFPPTCSLPLCSPSFLNPP